MKSEQIFVGPCCKVSAGMAYFSEAEFSVVFYNFAVARFLFLLG